LILAGRVNDSHFRNAAERLSNSNPKIVFLEELDQVEVARHILDADIILVPSRDDTLPLVSIEALAAGKVLICSATTGTADYIIDGQSGFILHHNGPHDVCQTLMRVLDRKAEWADIGANARRLYETRFTPDAFKTRLFRLLGLEADGFSLERSQARSSNLRRN
jgi:O-antigen biosynthesis protein